MPALNDEQLARMRATGDRHLPDSCTVHNKTRVSNGRGGYTTTLSSAVATYDCRKGKAEIVQAAKGGSLQEVTRYPLTLESGAVVDVAQVVKINGATYEVIAESGRSWEINPSVIIERVV